MLSRALGTREMYCGVRLLPVQSWNRGITRVECSSLVSV